MHNKTEHIELDYNFIREECLRKHLLVEHVSNACQVADGFTKGLGTAAFQNFKSKLMAFWLKHKFEGGCEG